MKTLITISLLLFIIATNLPAQNAARPSEPDKSKMEIFKGWVGHWKGEGSMQQGPGAPRKSTVNEKIEMKLDGMILAVEGIGKTDEGTDLEKTVHHAFAVLYYDQVSKTYKFKSFLKDGRSTDAWFEVAGENKYKWGFDIPNGKIAYTINIDPAGKKWNEIGEYSADGSAWQKFFEMNLTKVE